MASTIHHLSVGQLYIEKYLNNYKEEERKRFLLGTIAADWNSVEKKTVGVLQNKRKISHFVTKDKSGEKLSFEHYIPDIERFLQEYSSRLDDPFILGYLIHLITDKIWFEKIIPIFVERHLKEINPHVSNIKELNNEEYLNWYRSNFYHDFDVHDSIIGTIIFSKNNNFPHFDDSNLVNLEIDGMNLNYLSVFLKKVQERLNNIEQIPINDVIQELEKCEDIVFVADLHTICNFIAYCVDTCNEVIKNCTFVNDVKQKN